MNESHGRKFFWKKNTICVIQKSGLYLFYYNNEGNFVDFVENKEFCEIRVIKSLKNGKIVYEEDCSNILIGVDCLIGV